MILEPIVFFDLIIAIFILAACLAGIVISYTKTIQKFHALDKEKRDAEAEIERKVKHILHEARKRALKIVENANLFDDSTKKLFDQELKKVSEGQVQTLQKLSYDLLNNYQKELVDLKENNIKMLNIISKDIENSTITELKDFKEILKKETYESQKIVEGKIEDAYKIAQKEIEDYKIERLKIVESQIYEIIQTVAKIAMGKSLSLEEHEQLVIDALEKAKKEEVI